MSMQYFIEVRGSFDSRILWRLIKGPGVNLLDLDDVVLVYGEVPEDRLDYILTTCSIFGDCIATIRRR